MYSFTLSFKSIKQYNRIKNRISVSNRWKILSLLESVLTKVSRIFLDISVLTHISIQNHFKNGLHWGARIKNILEWKETHLTLLFRHVSPCFMIHLFLHVFYRRFVCDIYHSKLSESDNFDTPLVRHFLLVRQFFSTLKSFQN